MKKFYQLSLGISLLVVMLSCGSSGSLQGGTESGNPSKLSIQILGYQSSELAITVGGLSVDAATIVIDELRFKRFSACQGENEDDGSSLNIKGPFIVDLLDSSLISGLEDIQIPADRYCRIEIILKKLDIEDLPNTLSPTDPIVGRSIYIEGLRTDSIPFQMTTEFDEEFKLENETEGFLFGTNFGVTDLLIAFDLDQWFAGINLLAAGVEVSTDGSGDPIVHITDDSNESLQELIEDNIKRSADLFEDKDSDDELDDDEQDDSLAEGNIIE